MSPPFIHRSSPAKSGPSNDPPQSPTARKPPPRWLHTLWLVGLLVTVVLLFLPRSSSSTTTLTYTDWKNKVDANGVKTATIDPSGKVTGELTNKKKYESRIPAALKDEALASELIQHHVAITGTGSSTSI